MIGRDITNGKCKVSMLYASMYVPEAPTNAISRMKKVLVSCRLVSDFHFHVGPV